MFPSKTAAASRGLCAFVALSLIPVKNAAAAAAFAPTAFRQKASDVYAITNAKIVTMAGRTIEKGTIVLRDGLIADLGEKVTPPADARVLDGTGLTIYPGLIDSFTHIGMPQMSEYPARTGDAYPLGTVRPEYTATTLLKPDAAGFDARRKLGFGAALTVPQVGLFSGSSALLLLGEQGRDLSRYVLKSPVALHLNFNAQNPDGGYPESLMGQFAAARQAMYAAREAQTQTTTYEADPKGKPRPASNRSLVALRPLLEGKMPLILHAASAQAISRALRFAREFDIKNPVIDGATEAFAVVDELKKANATVLLTADLPTPPKVAPGDDDQSTLQILRRRAQAPLSAAALQKAGIPFALTTDGMENVADLTKNVRRMIAAGWTEEQAAAALTTTPARFFGVDRQIGSLAPGKIADLVAVEGAGLFGDKAKIKYVFVDGAKVELPADSKAAAAPGAASPATKQAAAAPPVDVAKLLPPGVTVEQAREFFKSNPDEAAKMLPPGITMEQAKIALGLLPAPAVAAVPVTKTDDEKATAPPVVSEGTTPPLPPQAASSFVLRGATVWTVGPQGTLGNADVYVRDGKIAGVGAGLKVPGGTQEIDAKGKQISPGMIDCHSHTAISGGVNEGTNIVTAECRIQDVLNPEDINIYRQLAGGTTTANVLHGSANAIGGQNAVVKWRWGSRSGEEMLLKGAPEGIKFALGENPKGSNWNVPPGTARRYPSSRLGVEKVIRNAFLDAQDYKRQLIEYKQGKRAFPPTRNLQLDALVEVMDGKRLVHCHSYRQDEILMMMRTAEDFGFRVATFQHVLEGYKIADEIAKHGAGGSTFSDWWAYKIEAYDAIPQNGALMTERGVVASFNSDDDELARRLNYEAAKAVHWGGMKPEEAIKLLTINPAKQLRIDKMVGSLEPGKDADLVVWSGDPLSTGSICEKTFVDGRLYFDRASDLASRPAQEAEKKRLLQAETKADAKTPPVKADAKGAETAASASPASETGTTVAPMPLTAAISGIGPVTAIIGGTIHTVSGADISNGVVLMQGDKIVAVGTKEAVAVPAGAATIDAAGLQVYPGMIDADTQLGLTEIGSIRSTNDALEMGDFSPELRAAVAVNPDSELIPVARETGVLAAVTAPQGGTLSGMGDLLNLDGWTWEDMSLNKTLGLYLNFPYLGSAPRRFRPSDDDERVEERVGTSNQDDYDREMRAGQTPAIAAPPVPAPGGRRRGAGAAAAVVVESNEDEAALRPLSNFLDEAKRYRDARKAESDNGVPRHDADPKLEAMMPVLAGQVPLFVRANREREIRAAVAWAKKENLKMVLVGGREADKCTDLLVKENVPVVLGEVLSLPARDDAAYDESFTLPARLAKAGVRFCLSTGSASDVRRLPYQAAMASAYGLPHDVALKAITLYPAEILGAGSRLGSIEAGKQANLFLATGDPLEIETTVKAAFIAGHPVNLATKQTRLYDRYRARPKK